MALGACLAPPSVFLDHRAQITEIPLMTPEDERKLADKIEVTRRCYRREVLECHLALAQVVALLKKLNQELSPFERTIRVRVSDRLKKDEIRSLMSRDLDALAILMDFNVRDFQAFVRERDRLVRRGLISDIKYRRRMAVDLVEESPVETRKIRPLMQRLEEAAGRMGALMTQLKNHRAGHGRADDPARIRQRLKRLMRMTLETPKSLMRRVRAAKARFREYEQAKRALAADCSRLVVSIAERYRNRGVSFEKLLQAGEAGLMRAVDKYEYQPDYRFSTCATWWIRQTIARAIAAQARVTADQGHILRIPRSLRDEADQGPNSALTQE
jgi:RNA polymerase primary sigma factor